MPTISIALPVCIIAVPANTKTKSGYAIAAARDEFLVKFKYWFVVGGIIILNACGKVTSFNTWLGVSPIEAAASIGLTPSQVLKLVIMPQALRIIIPPTTNQYLNLTKNSSLAAAIAYPDLVLVFAGTAMMQTGRAIEIVGITMATYLTISLGISLLMNWYNKRIAIQEK